MAWREASLYGKLLARTYRAAGWMPDAEESQTAPLRPAVVDLEHSKDVVAQLHAALIHHGFVAIRNSGIPASRLDAAFASARHFFAQSSATKTREAYSDTKANFGYQGMQSEALDPTIQPDLKEAFTMRSLNNRVQAPENTTKAPSKTVAEQDWVDTEFGTTATALYRSCSDVSLQLLQLLATALGSPPQTFAPHHTGENMTLRYLHYPSIGPEHAAGKEIKPQLGAGAHTDYGTITLLFSDGIAGLQLFDASQRDSAGSAGRWRDVEVTAGDVLVNTGDLMSLWSNGAYPSTLHRVQPRLGKPERYSIAFFVDPDSVTQVSPLPSCINSVNSVNSDRALEGTEGQISDQASKRVVVAGEHIQARIEASQRTRA